MGCPRSRVKGCPKKVRAQRGRVDRAPYHGCPMTEPNLEPATPRRPGPKPRPFAERHAARYPLKLTAAERAELDSAAERAGETLAVWARATLLRAARRRSRAATTETTSSAETAPPVA